MGAGRQLTTWCCVVLLLSIEIEYWRVLVGRETPVWSWVQSPTGRGSTASSCSNGGARCCQIEITNEFIQFCLVRTER